MAPPVEACLAQEMIVLTDANFARAEGNPPDLKVCARGTWNERLAVRALSSMLATLCRRVWRYSTMRLAFAAVLFNVQLQWDGLPLSEQGEAHLSIAQFSLWNCTHNYIRLVGRRSVPKRVPASHERMLRWIGHCERRPVHGVRGDVGRCAAIVGRLAQDAADNACDLVRVPGARRERDLRA